jgi:hypothetical protein
MNIFDEVREHMPFHEHDQAATGAPDQPGHVATLAQAVHRDVTMMGRVVGHALPLLERIVANPQLDEFVETALAADGMGVCAEAFTAASDVLRAAMARTATGPAAPEPLPQRVPGATMPSESSGEAPVAGENHSGVTPDVPAPANGSPSLSAPQAPADGATAQETGASSS